MTVMYSFCFWFPVRLGAIIVAVTCACESLASLIAAVYGILNLTGTSETIDDWLEQNDLKAAADFFVSMRNDPHDYLVGFITALSLHIFSCILLVFGAFWCSLWLIAPFLVIDFIRLILLSAILVILLLIIKANTLTLGSLIGCSICGGFILLYLWYQWFCVVSLCQILREVRRMDRNQVAPKGYPNNVRKQDLSLHPPYIYNHTYHQAMSELPKLAY